MDLQQRQQRFKKAVEVALGGDTPTRWCDAYGFSNSAKVVDGGLFAFNVNLSGLSTATRRLAVNCVIRLAPAEAIYFTVVVGTGLDRLIGWLDAMKAQGVSSPRGRQGESEGADAAEGEPEDETEDTDASGAKIAKGKASPFTNNSKNVKGYIGTTGELYVRNKGFWDSLPEDVASIPGGGFAIDAIHFAVWPAELSDRKSLFAREFVSYLGALVGPAKVHEVLPWPGTAAVAAGMRVDPAGMDVSTIVARVEAMGGFYPGGEVERLHAALNFSKRKHFAILSGLSGTGKSQLIQQYARAVHGITSMSVADPLLVVCPVRPDWTDPTGLTGYPDVLAKKYAVPEFLRAALLAMTNADSPVYVVLDEMNLARVEYYFADVLSCMENPTGMLTLHNSGVPWEGSNGMPIPSAVPLPSNLYIVGTVNVDETTHPISDKVLDRALLIDMSSVKVGGFLDALKAREPELAQAIDDFGPALRGLNECLAPFGQAFGYRVAEESVRYVSFATAKLGLASETVLDDLMVQKLLSKLRGGHREGAMLTGLRATVKDGSKAAGHLDRLLADLEQFGSFQASR